MNPIETFKAKAPWIMGLLIEDFGFDAFDAAAVVGNAGHESGGLTVFQERNPTIKGSRGGFGWFQWTGPRRRTFEAYCQRAGFDPRGDKANYSFLFVELKGPEARAVAATKREHSLKDKVVAFEMAYERAGIKHYPSRVKWAERALAAWNAATPAQKTPPPEFRAGGIPPQTKPATEETTSMAGPAMIAVPVLLELLKVIAGKVGEDRREGGPAPAPMPTPISNPVPLPETVGKSPIQSLTVGSAVVTLIASGFASYQAFTSGDTEAAMAGVTAVMGSLGAIIGRFKAARPIGKS